VLLLTAHNAESGYWDVDSDGNDGAGVVAVHDAVVYAVGCTDVSHELGSPVAESGFYTNQADSTMVDRTFRARAPDQPAPGTHLRVALCWTSMPDYDVFENVLSDLDLGGLTDDNDSTYGSYSLDANVEMIDVPVERLTPGGEYPFTVYATNIRIPSGARSKVFYYTVGWTSVRDHADSTVGVAYRPESRGAIPAVPVIWAGVHGDGVLRVRIDGGSTHTAGQIRLYSLAGRLIGGARVPAGERGQYIVPLQGSLPHGSYIVEYRSGGVHAYHGFAHAN
jgi:hypothetical protein